MNQTVTMPESNGMNSKRGKTSSRDTTPDHRRGSNEP